jgi:ABC-type multidrug transport system ATPase subunit/pSer/pThr/pTyr-binding forkhead associated (FHA) protein
MAAEATAVVSRAGRLRVRLEGSDLVVNETAVVGRDPAAEIPCLDGRVSRRHLELRPGPDGWMATDLGSSNGSFRDGERIQTLAVGQRLQLRLGDAATGVLLELELVPPPASVGVLRVHALDRDFTLSGSDPMTIGRDASNTLTLADSRVSRFHAQLQVREGAWWLDDLKSSNGTFAGGKRIDRLQIKSLTQVSLGDAQGGVSLELTPIGLPTVAPESDGLTVASTGSDDGTVTMQRVELGPMTVVHRPSTRLTIGRGADNDVVLSDLSVSRHHAEMTRGEGGVYDLIDLQTHNGTYLNGRRIQRASLRESDLIAIGNHNFRFQGGQLEEYSPFGEISFEVHGLTVRAGGNVLLDDISFTIPKRSLVAAVGPSGAGKSTLLGALTGFRPAAQGQVLYGARDLYACYDEFRQRIGYVPQDDILHPTLTVRRALQFAAELRFPPDVPVTDRERRVEEVMAELHLSERADLRIDKLSGGQRKRVSIALELLTRASLLFLDEPTSGLDPGLELELMELLRELAAGGRTVILVTHSVQSLDLCDRVLFLAPGGKMAYFGPPHDVIGYFDRSSFAEVFGDLERRRELDFKQRFRASSAYETYVRRPLADQDMEVQNRSVEPPEPLPRRQSWFRQFSTLSRRYVAVISSDRVNTALLLFQAPMLAVIILLAVNPGGFDVKKPGALSPGLQTILFLALCASYLGLGNSIREIVKELPIYARERTIGLSITAYLSSKVMVLAMVTAFQVAVLVVVASWRGDGPQGGVVLPNLRLELWVAMFATGLASTGMGLLVSSLVTKADKAVTLLPLLLIPQLVLTSPDLRIQDKPVLNQLSYAASAQWGHAAAASTIHLNQLIYNRAISLDPTVARQADPDRASDALIDQVHKTTNLKVRHRWRHVRDSWLVDIGVLMALFALELLLAAYALRRRDPALLSTGAGRRRGRLRVRSRLRAF